MKSCIENNTVVAIKRMRYLMNTFCSIQAEGEDRLLLEESVEEAFLELRRIESLFSKYMSNSQISKLNEQGSNVPIKVNEEIFKLIDYALQISRMTDGAFDITIGAAIDFWRASEREELLPSESRLQELLQKIGYKNIALDYSQRSIFLEKPGMQIDLGAVAKGYALNRAVMVLRQKGIEAAQVNLGGNIYVLDIEPQTIAIRHPVYADEVITTVSLMNTSISTSANYERSFTIAGRKFGHLINPLTGFPAESDILSASVISPDAALADALSTAIFVLGFKKGQELLEGVKDASSVIIYKGILGNLKVYKNSRRRQLE